MCACMWIAIVFRWELCIVREIIFFYDHSSLKSTENSLQLFFAFFLSL